MSKHYNILLMMADQARHDAVACNHDPKLSSSLAQVIKTPNLDRLADSGLCFRNSYTTNPICVPARATIITGNYSHKCTDSKSNSGRILEDQVKLPQLFADNGYLTYAAGKLHYVPYSPPGKPRLVHGFQKVALNESGRMLRRFDPMGQMQGLEDYHDYLKTVGWGGYERAHGTGNNDVHPAPSPLPAEHYSDAWVADRGIAFIRSHLEEHGDRPFLLKASFAKPHSPYDPPRPYDSMYDPREVPEPLGGWENDAILEGRDALLQNCKEQYGWDKLSAQAAQVARAHYCGLMSFQDAQIGRLFDCLEELGIADNTIVIYISDHGDLLGDFGRFFKVSMFDGSVKVPMIWRAPGVIPADDPHRRDQLVSLADIFPTFCALAGVELPCEVDGMDLTPILRDPGAPGRECLVSQTMEPPRQKYMLRTPQWKYVYTQVEGIEELYDVRREDYELHNLADDPQFASVKAGLRKQLIEWCVENKDEKMVKDGELAVSSRNVLSPREFSAGRMGWRKY